MYIDDRVYWWKCRVELTNKIGVGRGGEDPGRSMAEWDLSLMQNRDCANFVVSWLNHMMSLINAFIFNSPGTLNCPITASTLTDQSNLLPKSNPNQIQNQGVSLPTGTVILSSMNLHTHGTRAPSRGADSRVHSMPWLRDTRHPTCLPSFPHTSVRALSQGCHTHSPSMPSSPGAMPRTPVHWGQWKFSLGLKESPSPQQRSWGKKPS